MARLRTQAIRLDTQPGLLAFARRLRQRLPGDERFGDSLSTAGVTPVQVIARGVTAMQPERDSVAKELGANLCPLPSHVTLYSTDPKDGIGINNETQLRERAPELSEEEQEELRRAMQFDEVFGPSPQQ